MAGPSDDSLVGMVVGGRYRLTKRLAAGGMGVVYRGERMQLGRPVGSLFDNGGSTYALLGYFLSVPYVASARFLGYVDSRTRREGWDIQVRFAALLQRAATEEAA